MSEFIAVCPKCRQQILCDTSYVGLRIACPICLQEITMPAASQQSASPPHSQQTGGPGSPPPPSAVVGRKSNSMILVAAIGAVILVLAAGAVILAFHKNSSTATLATPPATAMAGTPASAPAPAPAPTTPPPVPTEVPAAAVSDLYTNHLTLDTPSFTVKITETRRRNVLNSLNTTYDCVSKNFNRRIVLKGEDSYDTGSDGTTSRFTGWTFMNASTKYFVSGEGELKVTQGTNVLVLEKGKWKKKPDQVQ
jgi:hypothetical protein